MFDLDKFLVSPAQTEHNTFNSSYIISGGDHVFSRRKTIRKPKQITGMYEL